MPAKKKFLNMLTEDAEVDVDPVKATTPTNAATTNNKSLQSALPSSCDGNCDGNLASTTATSTTTTNAAATLAASSHLPCGTQVEITVLSLEGITMASQPQKRQRGKERSSSPTGVALSKSTSSLSISESDSFWTTDGAPPQVSVHVAFSGSAQSMQVGSSTVSPVTGQLIVESEPVQWGPFFKPHRVVWRQTEPTFNAPVPPGTVKTDPAHVTVFLPQNSTSCEPRRRGRRRVPLDKPNDHDNSMDNNSLDTHSTRTADLTLSSTTAIPQSQALAAANASTPENSPNKERTSSSTADTQSTSSSSSLPPRKESEATDATTHDAHATTDDAHDGLSERIYLHIAYKWFLSEARESFVTSHCCPLGVAQWILSREHDHTNGSMVLELPVIPATTTSSSTATLEEASKELQQQERQYTQGHLLLTPNARVRVKITTTTLQQNDSDVSKILQDQDHNMNSNENKSNTASDRAVRNCVSQSMNRPTTQDGDDPFFTESLLQAKIEPLMEKILENQYYYPRVQQHDTEQQQRRRQQQNRYRPQQYDASGESPFMNPARSFLLRHGYNDDDDDDDDDEDEDDDDQYNRFANVKRLWPPQQQQQQQEQHHHQQQHQDQHHDYNDHYPYGRSASPPHYYYHYANPSGMYPSAVPTTRDDGSFCEGIWSWSRLFQTLSHLMSQCDAGSEDAVVMGIIPMNGSLSSSLNSTIATRESWNL